MDLRTITVAELIELLEDQPKDARVILGADYGDRCHTEQALPLRGECEQVTISKSAYSSSGYAIAEPDEDDDEETADGNETFLVIR